LAFLDENFEKYDKINIELDGVFGLWADGFPEDTFTNLLCKVFNSADAHTIEFDNPLTGGVSEGAVYLARVSPQ